MKCSLCPRQCRAERTETTGGGFCRMPELPVVARAALHHWEEPPISGTRGSGTIFFSGCSLGCVFCQNYNISAEGFGQEITIERLAEIFLEQQERGFHNINLVSAVQFIPQVAKALKMAKEQGLNIPVVYNSNGYESIEGLRMLEGLVDMYLPDFKYWDNELGLEYSNCPNYRETAAAAILEMRRQVGKDILDENGLMKKGIILRHLVLPGQYKDSMKVLDWIKENLGEDTFLSLMSQYTPMHRAKEIKALSRKLTTFEYDKVVDHFFEIGLKNGFMQKRSSATSEYTPTFDLSGVMDAESFIKREEK